MSRKEKHYSGKATIKRKRETKKERKIAIVLQFGCTLEPSGAFVNPYAQLKTLGQISQNL